MPLLSAASDSIWRLSIEMREKTEKLNNSFLRHWQISKRVPLPPKVMTPEHCSILASSAVNTDDSFKPTAFSCDQAGAMRRFTALVTQIISRAHTTNWAESTNN